MIRLPLFAVLLLQMAVSHSSALAQENTETLHEINKIKLDGSYVWAEGTSRKSEKEAMDNAQAVLEFEIQNWIKTLEEKDVAGVVMPTNDQCLKIQTQRAKLYRSFVYVPKNLILPYYKNEKLVVVENMSPASLKTEAETVEENQEVKVYEPTPFEKEMMAVKTGNAIAPFFKNKGIIRHGKFKNRPQDGIYYVFLYEKDGNIRAYLKSVYNAVTNIVTGEPDNYSNYKDSFARWFIYDK